MSLLCLEVETILLSFAATFKTELPMDINALDQALKQIADRKNALSELDYSNEKYDTIEEELHDLEDKVVEDYGSYLEDAIHEVHDEYCPDTEVLSPIAYLGNKFEVDDDSNYKVTNTEGVPVDVDDYPGKLTKLVLVPGPTRILLQVVGESQEEVWRAS